MSARRYGQEQAAKVQPPERPLDLSDLPERDILAPTGYVRPPSIYDPPETIIPVDGRRIMPDPHTAALDSLADAIRELAAAIRTGLEVPDAQG